MIKNSVAGPESNSNFEAPQNDLDFYNMGAPMQIVGLEDLAQPFKLSDSAVQHSEPMPMTVNEAVNKGIQNNTKELYGNLLNNIFKYTCLLGVSQELSSCDDLLK